MEYSDGPCELPHMAVRWEESFQKTFSFYNLLSNLAVVVLQRNVPIDEFFKDKVSTLTLYLALFLNWCWWPHSPELDWAGIEGWRMEGWFVHPSFTLISVCRLIQFINVTLPQRIIQPVLVTIIKLGNILTVDLKMTLKGYFSFGMSSFITATLYYL